MSRGLLYFSDDINQCTVQVSASERFEIIGVHRTATYHCLSSAIMCHAYPITGWSHVTHVQSKSVFGLASRNTSWQESLRWGHARDRETSHETSIGNFLHDIHLLFLLFQCLYGDLEYPWAFGIAMCKFGISSRLYIYIYVSYYRDILLFDGLIFDLETISDDQMHVLCPVLPKTLMVTISGNFSSLGIIRPRSWQLHHWFVFSFARFPFGIISYFFGHPERQLWWSSTELIWPDLEWRFYMWTSDLIRGLPVLLVPLFLWQQCSLLICCVINLAFSSSYRDKTGRNLPLCESIRPLLPVILEFSLFIIWANCSSCNILGRHPRLFYVAMGTIFSNIAVSLDI